MRINRTAEIAGVALLLLFLLAVMFPPAAAAQGDPPPQSSGEDGAIPKVHVVAEGETLFYIASLYDTTVDALLLLNGLSDADVLFVGQELRIPGATGEVVPTVYVVEVGDTLNSIAADFNTTPSAIALQNRLVRIPDLYVGQKLLVESRTGSDAPVRMTGRPHVAAQGDTLLTIAARYNVAPAELAAANGWEYPGARALFPGQRIRVPGEARYQDLPGGWVTVRFNQTPAQGQTLVISVENSFVGEPTGRFGDQALLFTPLDDGYVALVGIDPYAVEPRVELELSGDGNRPWRSFSQWVAVSSQNYGTQEIVLAPELDEIAAPDVRTEEDQYLAPFYTQFTPTRYWEGAFLSPVTTTAISAGYGILRSYNGGPYDIYHSGVDFALPIGTPVFAPAAGEVILAETLDLRGNAIIIDHGSGVMTGYYHLATLAVVAGDVVARGQQIGEVGTTGLSTGAHLHWDVRIMNVPVNGQQWLTDVFP